MEVNKLEEWGFEYALYGLSLSYKDSKISPDEWWTKDKMDRMLKVSKKLAHRGGGHNKFLESIVVWLDINAPRYWWSEFDTYRVGVTKQSESTMHRLQKRPVEQEDFQQPIPKEVLGALNEAIADGEPVEVIKGLLPEAYLQRRVVCTNYKSLQHIYHQRKDHRLPEWKEFCKEVLDQLLFPEFIRNDK